MPVSDQQVEYFTEDVLQHIRDKHSPDVTLYVFQFIESNDNFRSRHAVLKKNDSRVNARIANTIKKLLSREDIEEVSVSRKECTLIRSYMRFKS